MSDRIGAIVALMIALSACTSARVGHGLSDEQESAVCRAQEYLRYNGYLTAPTTADRDKISLEMWDRLTYTKNGQLDWDALLASRRGTFDGRLYGVIPAEGGVLIAYQMQRGFRCLFVGEGAEGEIHLNEATCRPKQSILIRINETSLSCPSAPEP